jgi:predicted polyphosphate/ATP-dependent NAD kinase
VIKLLKRQEENLIEDMRAGMTYVKATKKYKVSPNKIKAILESISGYTPLRTRATKPVKIPNKKIVSDIIKGKAKLENEVVKSVHQELCKTGQIKEELFEVHLKSIRWLKENFEKLDTNNKVKIFQDINKFYGSVATATATSNNNNFLITGETAKEISKPLVLLKKQSPADVEAQIIEVEKKESEVVDA